jgi:hypothetical protein
LNPKKKKKSSSGNKSLTEKLVQDKCNKWFIYWIF